jgi:hypothetical protein
MIIDPLINSGDWLEITLIICSRKDGCFADYDKC